MKMRITAHKWRWDAVLLSLASFAVIATFVVVSGTSNSSVALAQTPGELDIETPDDRLVMVAESVPEFGGLFLESEDSTVLNVYLQDPEKLTEVEPVLEQVYGVDRLSGKTLNAVEAEFSILDLSEWRKKLAPFVWKIPGVVMTDLSEQSNKINIGVEKPRTKLLVRLLAAVLRVPQSAITLELTQAPTPALTLNDLTTVLDAGFQTAQIKAGQAINCTMGPITQKSAGRNAAALGFITNGHCTENIAVVDNEVFYQNLVNNRRVGVETVDPDPFTSFDTSSCPVTFFCKWSDSAFVKLDAGISNNRGFIAKTTGLGSKTISTTTPRFRVKTESVGVFVGESLGKVGQRTGWTTGSVATVQDTCQNYMAQGFLYLCQARVSGSAGIANLGDSGSPVFKKPDASDDVDLKGLLWGVQTVTPPALPTWYVFSPIGQVYTDLDVSASWSSCGSPFTC